MFCAVRSGNYYYNFEISVAYSTYLYFHLAKKKKNSFKMIINHQFVQELDANIRIFAIIPSCKGEYSDIFGSIS